ncbi:MAG: glycerol-3-phosphate dehydrogenase subunit GlpB, partial [Plesiomonas sp.]
MKFDNIVIGGGMAGLSAALRLVEAGQKTMLMASGQSALHFSSGSVDLLESEGDPRAALPAFMAAHPDHPYSKVGMQNIEASLADLQRHCAEQGLPLVRHDTNHQRLTPIGTLKRTWLSPDTCACVTDAPIPDVLLLATLEGFRDFHPALAAANLATHPRFAHCRILTGEIRLPQLAEFSRNPHEFRSADIARLCDKHHLVADLAREISRMVQESGVPGCRHIVLPACLSLGLVGPRLAELEQRT